MASSGKRKHSDNEDANDLTIDGINTISVKTYDGKTFSLQVKGSDTIISVKFKIRAKVSMPLDEQTLIFNDMVLDENNITLADYWVKKDSSLTLMRKSSGLVPIFINHLNEKRRYSVNVKLSDTIHNFKDQISRIIYPHGNQELVIVFNDIVLDDCGILADFHITVDSVLTVMRKSKPRTMEIFVKIAGKTISLDVIATTTIGQVKTTIMYKEHIPVDEQVLIFNGMVLDDSTIMSDFHIKKGSTLTLMRVSNERKLMQIFVNTVTGTSTSIEVKPSDTIGNLKKQIQDEVGIPIDKQVLIFDEMVLHDNGTLADFHIKRDSTLTLMRKSRGLMQIFVDPIHGTKVPLEVDPLDTIADLRARLGISPQTTLVFDGRRLRDSDTYTDHNILKNDVIDLYIRVTGGPGGSRGKD